MCWIRICLLIGNCQNDKKPRQNGFVFFLQKNCIDELELSCISMSCLNAAFFIQRLSILGQVWRWNEWTTDRVPVAEYSNAIVIILSIQIFSISQLTKLVTLKILKSHRWDLGKQLIKMFYDFLKIVTCLINHL